MHQFEGLCKNPQFPIRQGARRCGQSRGDRLLLLALHAGAHPKDGRGGAAVPLRCGWDRRHAGRRDGPVGRCHDPRRGGHRHPPSPSASRIWSRGTPRHRLPAIASLDLLCGAGPCSALEPVTAASGISGSDPPPRLRSNAAYDSSTNSCAEARSTRGHDGSASLGDTGAEGLRGRVP